MAAFLSKRFWPKSVSGVPSDMSIANELSSDVAAAVLARENEEPAVEARKLLDLVKEVHTTLRHLTASARKKTRDSGKISQPAPSTGNAAAGGYQ